MNIDIRKPILEEWEAYKVLRLEALKEFPKAFSSSYEEVLSDSDDDWKEFIKSSIEEKSSLMVCAYDDNKMVGSVASYWKNKKKIAHVCNLGGMFVLRDYQNQGVGQQLVQKLFELLKNKNRFRIMKLDVVEDNLSALNFYKKLGFVEFGISHDELLIDGKYYNLVAMEKFL